jgi:hypothetical protein
MVQLINSRLIGFCCAIFALCFFACNKDDDKGAGQIQLFSFGPTGARHGDTLRFVGSNLTQVTAIHFTGNNAVVENSAFIQQTGELILAIVPASAERGFVTLKTPQDDIVSKTRFNLNVSTAASITSMTLTARPGEHITLKGNYLNWVKRIVFNRDKAVTTFISQSLNDLVVKVPDDAQSGRLIVTFSGTDSVDVETADSLKVALPVTTSLSPNPVKHADNLTIMGTNLDLARKVIFPGVATPVTTFVSQSLTQLVVKVPGAAEKGKLSLEAASGVRTTFDTDLDLLLPAITSMTPNPVDPSTNLTITGTNLDLVSGIAFIGVPAAVTSFVSQSSTEIVVQVPATALRGKIKLNIKNSGLFVPSAQDLVINGSTVTPHVVYDNAFHPDWEKWGGWGTTEQDIANTDQPNSGANAIKVTYSHAYGALQLHPKVNFPFPGVYTKLRISIYGGANATATSQISIYVKDNADPKDAETKILTIVPGAYTTYDIPLSDFSNNPAKINEFVIKNYGTANMTIYIDDITFL